MVIACEPNTNEYVERERCLKCGSTFWTNTAALLVVRVGAEWLGYVCPECLDKSARVKFTEACARFRANMRRDAQGQITVCSHPAEDCCNDCCPRDGLCRCDDDEPVDDDWPWGGRC
jgi:hypothetical protein